MAAALQGQTALVTGASRGIGRAVAVELAAHGAAVAVNYLSSRDRAEEVVAEIASAGGRAAAIQADVASAEAASRLIAETEAALGPIDILVNNAGISRSRMVHRMSTDEWDSVIAADLSSAFYLSSIVARGMRERRYGRIINMSSALGQRPGIGNANYSAAKGGLIAFTRSVALELAPFGITVNAVCPGWVPTDINAGLDDDQRREILSHIPLGRFGTPEDIASMVRFLAVEGRWITGQQLNVNGGEHM